MNVEMKWHEYITISAVVFLGYTAFPSLCGMISGVLILADKHDGVAQLFVGLATIFFAYWIPSKYRQFDLINKKREEIYSFNEAVVKHGSVLERLISNVDRIIEAYHAEKETLENIEKFGTPNPNGERVKLLFVLPLMLPDVDAIVAKLAKEGMTYKIIQAYNRISPQIIQFDYISEHRGILAKLINESVDGDGGVPAKWFVKKHNELLRMTLDLLRCVEVILDHALHISPLMNELALIEKASFKKLSSSDITVCRLEDMQIYQDYRRKLRSMIDSIDGEGGRFLYFS